MSETMRAKIIERCLSGFQRLKEQFCFHLYRVPTVMETFYKFDHVIIQTVERNKENVYFIS